MSRSPDRAAAETLAAAIVEFINSRPHASPVTADTLDIPEQAKDILSQLLPATMTVTTEVVDQAKRIRASLVDLFQEEGDSNSDAWRTFNEIVAAGYRPRFLDRENVRWEQFTGPAIAGAIAQVVAELIAERILIRIRICANPECSHAFYDSSRSRTQRWHSYEVCGNRTNVAAYRARTRTVSPRTPPTM